MKKARIERAFSFAGDHQPDGSRFSALQMA